jgi:hypothetical protein
MIFGIFDSIETSFCTMLKHLKGRGFIPSLPHPVRIAIGQGYFTNQKFHHILYSPYPDRVATAAGQSPRSV